MKVKVFFLGFLLLLAACKGVRSNSESGEYDSLSMCAEKDKSVDDFSQELSVKASEWLKKAQAGDAEAQYEIACCYYYCEGAPKDFEQAAYWAGKSSEQGYHDGTCLLAVMYEKGEGVPKNESMADELYSKAYSQALTKAEKGDAAAQTVLAYLYSQGKGGVEKDYETAVSWNRKAAEQGYAVAQNNLGNYYAVGQGVPLDYITAVEWFRKAADQNLAKAQYCLGLCYEKGDGVPQDYIKAVEWYVKASEQGYANATISLALCYVNGTGVDKDDIKAVELIRKAANYGLAEAQMALGLCYYKGLAVTKDEAAAVKWLCKAARQGNKEAQQILQQMDYSW